MAKPRTDAIGNPVRLMRVLHLYSGNLYGGIERLLVAFARERRRCPELEPAFGLCFTGRLSQELTACGVPVFDLGTVRFSRRWTLWRARRRLHRLLQREHFDAVMTHAAWPHAAFARTVRKAGLPLAHWVHDVMTGPGNRFEGLAARVPPDLVVANSQFATGSVPNVFPQVRTEIVHLPVSAPERETEDRSAIRAMLKTPENHVVIVQASRLERMKGHHVLIRALGTLGTIPGWTAWIVGGPQKVEEHDYFTELQTLANQSGVSDRVRFLGQRNDVPQLLAAADIFCQPNLAPESFGIAFVEALHAGLPVVTSDLGGGREIVDARCGILVPPNDPHAVAETLAALIVNPDRRRALGAAGPTRARDLCDPARQLARVAVILKTIVKRKEAA